VPHDVMYTERPRTARIANLPGDDPEFNYRCEL